MYQKIGNYRAGKTKTRLIGQILPKIGIYREVKIFISTLIIK